jgi:hypothetical protein
MRNIKYLANAVFVCYGLASCTPDCNNITDVYFAEHPYIEEGEILIRSSNLNNLRDRDVFFNDIPAEELRFVTDVGLIAKMPKGANGEKVSLRIEDQDCNDFISYNLNVQSESFFIGNEDYIPPAPPVIIIPLPNPPLPPNINNAWVSPNNTDYCIWFVVVDVPGSPGNFTITPSVVNGKKSQELSVARAVCSDTSNPDTGLYHGNPVYGMINTTDNIIQFWVDRSVKGLGIEEFTGQFIDVEDTPFGDDRVPECGTWGETKLHMMMVTSKQSGRSLLLYQQL